MADVDCKQSLNEIVSADPVAYTDDIPNNSSTDDLVSVEKNDTATEGLSVTVSRNDDIPVSLSAIESCRRTENDVHLSSTDVTAAVKMESRRRKRTGLRQPVAPVNTETPAKRRRVQHNYRRLSSAGYVDDYDGRERFSGKDPIKNRLPPSKSKSVDSLVKQTSRQNVSKTSCTQSGVTSTVLGSDRRSDCKALKN